MRKLFLAVLASMLSISLIFLFVSIKSVATQERNVLQEDYVPNEVLVKFKKDVSRYFIREAINSVQGKIITYLGKEISTSVWDSSDLSLRSFRLDPDLLHIKVPEAIGTEQAIYLLNQNPNVEYAEKNGILHMVIEPDDPYFEDQYQWGLHNTGQEGGKVDADIDAPEAWDIFTGSSDIVVAVIDTGVDYGHIDFKDLEGNMVNIWTNEDEIPYNNIDDDNNGFKDDIHGWDFVKDDNTPEDINGHGTHVAGIIGAATNNDEGIAGVNWNVKIMVLKALRDNASLDAAAAAQAIDYATENDAHLSNNSWGSGTNYGTIYAAIGRARDAGKLFIAAAGNYQEGLKWYDNDIKPVYPSSHDLDNIISVAATNRNDNRWSKSHYGAYSVDLGAPGEEIYGTLPNDDYGSYNGTSMAAPHVAGVAALVWGHRPYLSWWQVKTTIMDSVDPLSSLSGKVRSGGRLNAYNALTTPTPDLPAAPSNLYSFPDCYEIRLTWQDNSDNEDGFKIYRKFGNKWFWLGWVGPNVTTWTDTELLCGELYCYYVRAYNQDGISTKTLSKCDKTTPCYYCDPWD